MKVLFDHLCFWQKFGGVPRYFVELMKHLPNDYYILTVKFSNNEYLKELPNIKYCSFLDNFYFKGKARLESEIGKLFTIPYLIRDNFDIYHQTHYDPYAFKYLSKTTRTITTIHDMNFYVIPEYYPKRIYLKKQMETSIKKVDKIITISNNSKRDLCNYLDVPENKVSVIYHGVDLKKFQSEKSDKNYKEQYILFVGARNKYKNFKNLLEAFTILRRQYSQIKLYCAGPSPTKAENELIFSKKIIDSVRFIQATERELVSLYKNALFFVFPSLYEGFGLPILEAMAANCPIVLSNTGSFPEIADNAGLYFNPYSIDDIYTQMKCVIENSALREKLKYNASIRVKDFTWERCVKQHLEVYNSLL